MKFSTRIRIRELLSLFFFASTLLTTPSTSIAASNLNDCFRAALIRSEDVANQSELMIQAEEKVRQAWGSILPSINGTFTHLIQPTPSSSSGASIFPGQQTTAKLTASQPLFQGFREFAALKQAKKNEAAAELNRNYAKQLLFQDVSQSVYQVLSAEQDLKNLKNEINLNLNRLTEVNRFRKIGRTREVEVLTLKSNIATLEAQAYSLEGQINSLRDVFSFLTGLPQNTQIEDNEPLPRNPSTIEEYLGRIDLRPDVLAQQSVIEATDAGLGLAKGAHLPSIQLSGNYYFVRPGVQSDVHWDVQLGMTLPLFQGGVIQSQVRTAASLNTQSELLLSKVKRNAKQQIESSYHLYMSDLLQVEKQKTALELSEKTYSAEQADYRRGLVTHIEVLQSLSAYQTNQRTLDRARYQLKADFLKLQAAAALRPNTPPTN